ncbi:MAG TPA: RimK-like protein [Thermoanaerobaculia bacterium]|jgi:glutathione synthase/RimK-type ligase-like ATP-grasp enzyme|nr:RimK-like protein [Thermoanaerobaculia bacterium]
MIIQNSSRALTQILKEICAEREIQLDALSSDWFFRLTKGTRVRHVFGYDFPLNNATAQMIAKDKAATAKLLETDNIPAVPHRIFHGPQLVGYVPMSGNWRDILDLFYLHNEDVVCKRNEGTGGSDVFRAKTVNELEIAVHRIFQKSRSLAISPYLKIDNEFRVIVLNKQTELVYAKQRPTLWGNGLSTINELALEFLANQANNNSQWEPLIESLKGTDTTQVLPTGELFHLNWRHNLGQGAQAHILEANCATTKAISQLALQATHSIDIDFASVDIVETQGTFQILEINSGIMMESLAQQGNRDYAKKIYEKAVCLMLEIYTSASD